MGAGVRWSEDQLSDYQSKRSPGRTASPGADRVRVSGPAKAGSGIETASRRPDLRRSAPISRPEEDLQRACVAWLEIALAADWRFLHIPNQRGTRSETENRILKALGVKAGAADLLILSPHGPVYWLELKSPTGSLSTAQRDWRDWRRANGLPWALIRSLEDLVAFCRDHQIPVRAR